MTLQQIKYVMEIANCGSISTAAHKLYLTQPYLSNVLHNLENELKITIFKRERNGVTLTDSGKEFLYYAKYMLEQEHHISEIYKTESETEYIRIDISSQRFPFIIKAFCDFYKKILPDRFEIHIREASMDRVISDVYEKRSVLGIIYISSIAEKFIMKYLRQHNLKFNKLACITPCIFFHHSHPMAKYDIIDIWDMQPYPFVSCETDSGVAMDFSEEALISDAPRFTKRFYVNERATVMNLLTNTNAFSIGSGILTKGFAGSELISRPIKNHSNELTIGWICSDKTVLSDEYNSFIEIINNIFY